MRKRGEEGVMIKFGPPFELDQPYSAMVEIFYFSVAFFQTWGKRNGYGHVCIEERRGCIISLGLALS